MPDLLTADGETIATALPLDKQAADRDFAAALVTEPSGDLPPREPAEPPADKPRRGRPRKDAADKPRVASGPARAATALTGDQRKDGVRGLVQLTAVIPLMLARTTGDAAYQADAVTLANSADAVAEACADVAAADPRFAAALDRVCSAGPYGALITVAFGVGAQLFRNHRPRVAIPGTVHPDELLAAAQQQAA